MCRAYRHPNQLFSRWDGSGATHRRAQILTLALAWWERRRCPGRQLHFGHQQRRCHRSHEQESLGGGGPPLTQRNCFHFKSFF